MQFRQLDCILDDLTKAVAWFESVGIPTKETRLQAIHHYLFDQLQFPAPGATMPDYDHHMVISDAAAFFLIATEYSRLPSTLLPRRTMKEAIYGPLPPSNEDAQSSDSRNKFFELELAAHLSMSGVKLVGFDDVQFQFEDHRYIVECKRPFIDRRFEDNLGKAYDQLASRLKAPNDRGLAAIAVEKVLDIDGSIHRIDSTPDALAFTKSQLDKLTGQIIAYGTTKDMRIVGVLFITRFLMRTRTAGTYAMNYLLSSLPFHYGDTDPVPEISRLDRLIGTLQQKFQSMDTGFR